jgi:hypothetical protein
MDGGVRTTPERDPRGITNGSIDHTQETGEDIHMEINSTPNRASDSGPDRPERPNDWRDELDAAEDSIKDVKRVYDIDGSIENRERLKMIDDAVDYLLEARRLIAEVKR